MSIQLSDIPIQPDMSRCSALSERMAQCEQNYDRSARKVYDCCIYRMIQQHAPQQVGTINMDTFCIGCFYPSASCIICCSGCTYIATLITPLFPQYIPCIMIPGGYCFGACCTIHLMRRYRT